MKITSDTESEDPQENEVSSFEPPLGFERTKQAKEISKFNVSEVENDKTEIWLIKVPSRFVRADLSGKSFKIPTDATEGLTKVATIQKKISETIFTSYQKRTAESTVEYGVYLENLRGENGSSSQRAIFDKMQEFEVLIPRNDSSNVSNGDLVLSSKKPTRYLNIHRELELSDPTNSSIISKKSEVPRHPPETFIPRFITTFPEFPKERIKEVNLEKENFREKLMNEWEFNRWRKEMRRHYKKRREAYFDWQEKCKMMIRESKEEFMRELVNRQNLKKGKRVRKTSKDKLNKKRKELNPDDKDNDKGNDDEDLGSEEFLTTTDEEIDYVRKKKIKVNHKSRKFALKLQNNNGIESEEEILAEVGEEEKALAKIAQEQTRIREERIKNLEDTERRTAETWTPSLVRYPKFEEPITWWSQKRDKILAEEGNKVKPYINKRDWSMQERLEYYEKYCSEAPPFPVSEPKGQEIEINYDGIQDKIIIPEPQPKRIKPPPKQGTLGHISPCVEYVGEQQNG